MKKLDEIALRVAEKHRAPQGHIQMSATEFVAEVNSLLAELSKDMEPFGWWHQAETEEESDFHLADSRAGEDCKTCIPLFTHPANIAEIEQRVAEAIAKMINTADTYEASFLADKVTVGEWSEYL